MRSFEEMLALSRDVECVFGSVSHPGLIEDAEKLETIEEIMSTAVPVSEITELSQLARQLKCGEVQVIRLPGNSGECRAVTPGFFEQLSQDECIYLACLSSSSPGSGNPTLAEQLLICYLELFVNMTSMLSCVTAYMVFARDLKFPNLLHPHTRTWKLEQLQIARAPFDSVQQLEDMAWMAARNCPDHSLISQFISELEEWLISAEDQGLRGAALLRTFENTGALQKWRDYSGRLAD